MKQTKNIHYSKTPPPPSRPAAKQIPPTDNISFFRGIFPTPINKTLTERGARYGDFPEHARISQNIKRAMQDSPNWGNLPPAHREALEMITHKIARVLNGDPDYDDSWHDLAGYATLVEQYILSEK